MIEIRSFSFAYRKNRTVLNDCSVTIGVGEIVNILGPNGSGKSTLLKAMLGLLPIGKNAIFIHGRDITRIRQRELAKILNYVPQTHQGVFNYRVLDMVLMARTSRAPWLGFTDTDHAIARDALRRVRLSALAERPYLELSGGQRQLVMIARARRADSISSWTNRSPDWTTATSTICWKPSSRSHRHRPEHMRQVSF